MFHLINSINIQNCCNEVQFLNKEIIMKYFAIKFFTNSFLSIKNYLYLSPNQIFLDFLNRLFVLRIAELVSETIQGSKRALNLNFLLWQSESITLL